MRQFHERVQVVVRHHELRVREELMPYAHLLARRAGRRRRGRVGGRVLGRSHCFVLDVSRSEVDALRVGGRAFDERGEALGVREDHGRRDGVEVLAHRFSRAARVGGVAQALEVGPLLGGTCLLVDVARRPCRVVLSHEARASLSLSVRHSCTNHCGHFLIRTHRFDRC
jgi:hypothetical protein